MMPAEWDGRLLAACGVNCAACQAYLRTGKNRCGGCQGPDELKRGKSCTNCAKKLCAAGQGLDWCFQCERFPCTDVKRLDKTYRTRYGINLVQNGVDAKRLGPDVFMRQQRARFTCGCGGVICQHDGICSECGKDNKSQTGYPAAQEQKP